MELPTFVCDNCGETRSLERGSVWYDVLNGKPIRFCSKDCKTEYRRKQTTPYPLAKPDAEPCGDAPKGE